MGSRIDRRKFLRWVAAGSALALAATFGVYEAYNIARRPENRANTITAATTPITTSAPVKPAYAKLDTELASLLDGLLSLQAQETGASVDLLRHSPSKTFDDLARMPVRLQNLGSYFTSTLPKFTDALANLLLTLESQTKDFGIINGATASVNALKPELTGVQPKSTGPFTSVFTQVNDSLSAAHDELRSKGTWNPDQAKNATAATLAGGNYASQAMNIYSFVTDLFDVRAVIGNDEKSIYSDFGSSPLDSRPLGTVPIKARERAFGRTVNYSAKMLQNISEADVANDGKILLDFRTAHSDLADASLWLSPTSITQLGRLIEYIGSQYGHVLYDAFTNSSTHKQHLPMLLERCSWYNPTYDKLTYVLTRGETNASNILDYCKLQEFPTDVDLTYNAVLEDLKFFDEIKPLMGFDLTKYTTLNPTPTFDPNTDILYHLKVAVRQKFPDAYNAAEKYNFQDTFSRLSNHSQGTRQGQLVFDQILNENANQLAVQNIPFYFMLQNYAWGNILQGGNSVLKDGKLWYHIWGYPNSVSQPAKIDFANLYTNDKYGHGGVYVYAGVGAENFPIMGTLLLKSDRVRPYAANWFTSILMNYS